MKNSSDRDVFQNLLESAFTVQQSGMACRSLSAIMKVQRFVRSSQATLASSMKLVVESVALIANADGVAIAMLRAGALVYQVGIGTAADCEGTSLAAVLTASNEQSHRCEILRVENPEVDSRVGAEICRQFNCNALLLLPIHRGQAIVGVLDIRFRRMHVFGSEELRTYRLMSGVLEEVLSGAESNANGKEEGQQAVPSTRDEKFRSFHFGVATVDPGTPMKSLSAGYDLQCLPSRKPKPEEMNEQSVATLNPLRRTGASQPIGAYAIITLMGVLLAQAWIAYDLHWFATQSPVMTAPKISQQARSASIPIRSSGNVPTSVTRPETVSAGAVFRRVQVGQNEVDYIADDVTIREFKASSTPRRVVSPDQKVYIGDDVIVHVSNRTAGHIP